RPPRALPGRPRVEPPVYARRHPARPRGTARRLLGRGVRRPAPLHRALRRRVRRSALARGQRPDGRSRRPLGRLLRRRPGRRGAAGRPRVPDGAPRLHALGGRQRAAVRPGGLGRATGPGHAALGLVYGPTLTRASTETTPGTRATSEASAAWTASLSTEPHSATSPRSTVTSIESGGSQNDRRITCSLMSRSISESGRAKARTRS